MAINVRSKRLKEQSGQLIRNDALIAGHNGAWKFLLSIASITAVTASSMIAMLAATVLSIICLETDSFSIFSVVTVFLINALLLLLSATIGLSKTYIIPIVSVFTVSLLVYSIGSSQSFDINFSLLLLSIGEFLSLAGAIAIAQFIVFTVLVGTRKTSFFVLITSFLLGTGLIKAVAQTTINQGDVSLSRTLFFIMMILFSSVYAAAFTIAQKALNKGKNFQWMMSQALSWAAIGGTSFKGLDLSNFDFTGSILENTDLRAKKFYRTCLKDVKGLERARLDNTYLDLDNPKVRELLVNGYSKDVNFSKFNLRGAYLKGADLRSFQLSEANLEGANLSNADLRESVLLRTILTDADLKGANLTGACIKDWSFNQQTCFDHIVCDYVYREYEQGVPSDRYPASRNFEPGEFQTLFQKLTNAVELIFKDQVDWRALSFAFEKFQIEDDGLGLELKGVEQRGNYWVVKVTHGEGVSRQKVERQVQETYDDLRGLLEAKDQQINQLLGIMDGQTKALNQQSEALNNYSQRSFGNNFFISGSNITNLAGSGTIEYREAAEFVRNLVTQPSESDPTLQRLLALLSDRNIATTADVQQDLIQQVLLAEAENDFQFKQLLLQDGEQMLTSLSNEALFAAVKHVMSQLRA